MGKIVGAFACSHVLGVEHFSDYPSREKNQVVEEKVGRVVAGIQEMGKNLRSANPDVLIVVSNDHLDTFSFNCIPPFCVRLGTKISGMDPTAYNRADQRIFQDAARYRLHDDFSTRLLEESMSAGHDLAFSWESVLDHGFLEPLGLMMENSSTPICPIYVNTTVPPIPTPQRCYQFGQTVGRIVEKSPYNVAILACGGMSHFPRLDIARIGEVNVEFDKMLLDIFKSGRTELLEKESVESFEEAGEYEILNWTVLAGAVGNKRAEVLAYEPLVPVSLAAVMWNVNG